MSDEAKVVLPSGIKPHVQNCGCWNEESSGFNPDENIGYDDTRCLDLRRAIAAALLRAEMGGIDIGARPTEPGEIARKIQARRAQADALEKP